MRVLFFLLLGTPALAATDGVCVTNGSENRMFFTAETSNGTRETGWLNPGGTLCAGRGTTAGTVGVFLDDEVIEGCSRLVPEGVAEKLLSYADIDRCRWATLQ